MDPILWVGLLFLVGLALILVEFFVPSGGVVGILCLAIVTAAIILAFYLGGMYTGFSFVIAAGIAVPCIVALGFKFWPRTSFGKKLLLEIPLEDSVRPERSLQDLVGKIGHAKTVMLLSGSIEIEGRVLDAVSEGMAIEKGQLVRVIEVRANRVIVRPAEHSSTNQPNSTANDDPLAKGDDILSRGIEELGLDDPLA